MMSIPIQNIYFLLCYAWNKLDEKERVNVSIDDTTKLSDLFAKILINATRILIKRGIDRSYIHHTEEISGVKGKLLIAQTLKSNILFKQRTICNFDDFSSNILANQILVTTIHKLVRTKEIDKQLQKELVTLLKMVTNIDQIQISNSLFKQLRFNRNNKFYIFIMNVCQIVFNSYLPAEEKGKYQFSDFTRDENKMPHLFEEFVRNFYKIEQTKFPIVKGENIDWKFESRDQLSSNYLPQMQTDITLENLTHKIIIDAKFLQQTMVLNYSKEKIKSANLYQLFSYLLNQEKETEKTKKATGILLYPTIDKDYDLNFKYAQHNILIRTVNLNTNWKNIHNRLLEIIS